LFVIGMIPRKSNDHCWFPAFTGFNVSHVLQKDEKGGGSTERREVGEHREKGGGSTRERREKGGRRRGVCYITMISGCWFLEGGRRRKEEVT
jgi:hypothetical protein